MLKLRILLRRIIPVFALSFAFVDSPAILAQQSAPASQPAASAEKPQDHVDSSLPKFDLDEKIWTDRVGSNWTQIGPKQ